MGEDPLYFNVILSYTDWTDILRSLNLASESDVFPRTHRVFSGMDNMFKHQTNVKCEITERIQSV